MSLLEQQNEENDDLKLNDTGKYFILGASRWMKFFAIFMIIMLSLLLLVTLMMGAAMTKMASLYGAQGASFGIGTIIFAILLYVYPIYALLKFANTSKHAFRVKDSELFNNSFRYLKGFFQYMGILIIIFIGIYLIFFIAIGLGAALGSAM